ncbi:MAG: HGGxSTG domain-containing protein, partial [Dongiaceae bacterium]
MTRPASSAHSAAWHGVHRSDSLPAASASTSLPPERRGRLKNGNSPGDFLSAPRCGARTRCGGECRQPAMPNGRCRLHGGLSTGPRTP